MLLQEDRATLRKRICVDCYPMTKVSIDGRFDSVYVLSPSGGVFTRRGVCRSRASVGQTGTLLRGTRQLFFDGPIVIVRSASRCRLVLFRFFSRRKCSIVIIGPLRDGSVGSFSVEGEGASHISTFGLTVVCQAGALHPSRVPRATAHTLHRLYERHTRLLGSISDCGGQLATLLSRAFPNCSGIFSSIKNIASHTILMHFPAPAVLLMRRRSRLISIVTTTDGFNCDFTGGGTKLLVSTTRGTRT